MSRNSKAFMTNFGDPLPEDHPKILNSFMHFRVMIREDLREEHGTELPIIPMTREIKSRSLREYADNRVTIKNGEFISYKRYDSRLYSQYIFATEDGIEIVIPECYINKKFLFPINKN